MCVFWIRKSSLESNEVSHKAHAESETSKIHIMKGTPARAWIQHTRVFSCLHWLIHVHVWAVLNAFRQCLVRLIQLLSPYFAEPASYEQSASRKSGLLQHQNDHSTTRRQPGHRGYSGEPKEVHCNGRRVQMKALFKGIDWPTKQRAAYIIQQFARCLVGVHSNRRCSRLFQN